MLKRVPRRRGRHRPPLDIMRGGVVVETYIRFEQYRSDNPEERIYRTYIEVGDETVFDVDTTITRHMSDRLAWKTHYWARREARGIARQVNGTTMLPHWEGKVKR